MPGMPYEVKTEPLGSYNALFLFSDGVYEITRPDGTMWEFADFERELTRLVRAGEPEIEKIFELAKSDIEGEVLDDDFSMVKIQLP